MMAGLPTEGLRMAGNAERRKYGRLGDGPGDLFRAGRYPGSAGCGPQSLHSEASASRPWAARSTSATSCASPSTWASRHDRRRRAAWPGPPRSTRSPWTSGSSSSRSIPRPQRPDRRDHRRASNSADSPSRRGLGPPSSSRPGLPESRRWTVSSRAAAAASESSRRLEPQLTSGRSPCQRLRASWPIFIRVGRSPLSTASGAPGSGERLEDELHPTHARTRPIALVLPCLRVGAPGAGAQGHRRHAAGRLLPAPDRREHLGRRGASAPSTRRCAKSSRGSHRRRLAADPGLWNSGPRVMSALRPARSGGALHGRSREGAQHLAGVRLRAGHRPRPGDRDARLRHPHLRPRAPGAPLLPDGPPEPELRVREGLLRRV